jgi:hypothetical protein
LEYHLVCKITQTRTSRALLATLLALLLTAPSTAIFATVCESDAFHFVVHDEELQRRFRPDPDGMGYRLEDIPTRHPTFDRVGLLVDMVDEESVPVADVRVFAGAGQGWSDWMPLSISWSGGILHNAYVEVPHGGTRVQLRLRSPGPHMVSYLTFYGFIYMDEGEGYMEEAELDD